MLEEFYLKHAEVTEKSLFAQIASLRSTRSAESTGQESVTPVQVLRTCKLNF